MIRYLWHQYVTRHDWYMNWTDDDGCKCGATRLWFSGKILRP